jgi:DNA-binding beta-propeller fold protein YncE
MRMALSLLVVAIGGIWLAGCDGCGDTGKNPAVDAKPEPALDGPLEAAKDVAMEVPPSDAPPPDTTPDLSPDAGVEVSGDTSIVHSCGAFSTPSNWTTAAGFRSAVVAMGAPLSMPVAITFAAGPYGESAYVVDQGARAVFKIDTRTGTVTPFVAMAAWPRAPGLLTTSVWDAEGAFDGRLYIGDQGGDGDADSAIFRVDPAGAATLFAMGPGPGMDDIYGLAFSPGGAYPAGLYVSGDTDGASAGFGRLDANGANTMFAMFAGVEGLAIDRLNRFGGGLFASMPAGGGYSGDDTISKINPDGTKGTPLVTAQPGIHAIVFAPSGPFGGDAYAASWQSQKLLRIAPGGAVSDLATGLALTNYDGNILSFSPDGRVLFVADRAQARIVCIEAM